LVFILDRGNVKKFEMLQEELTEKITRLSMQVLDPVDLEKNYLLEDCLYEEELLLLDLAE